MEMNNDNLKEEPVFDIQCNEVLIGNSCNYHIETLLGAGAFGIVTKCKVSTTNNYVAVKILRSDCFKDGEYEAKTMEQIRKLDPDKNNLLTFIEHFIHRGYFCLVYDLLDVSLYDFMKKRHFQPLDLNEIRVIGQQLLVSLRALKGSSLVHSDIKPDNIMLVNHQSQPFKVKLIDFGLATKASKLWINGNRQILPYRSPEALLHLPSLDEGVDMWSLGCLLAFLYLGGDLYPYECEYEAMRMILQLNGEPDSDFLDTALDSDVFFNLVQEGPERLWCLKSPEEYTEETGEEIVEHRRASSKFNSLDDLLIKQPRKSVPVIHQDTLAFISLLKQMLAVNPRDRITPSEALCQDFFTFKHFAPASKDPYVLSAKEMMTRCHLEEVRDISTECEEENSRPSGSHSRSDHSFVTAASLNIETTNEEIDRVAGNSKHENINGPGILESLAVRYKTFEVGTSEDEVTSVPTAGNESEQGTSENLAVRNTTVEANSSIEGISSAPRTGTEDQQRESALQLSGNVGVNKVKTSSGIHKFFAWLFKPFRTQRKKVK